jgi:hypothetical protein
MWQRGACSCIALEQGAFAHGSPIVGRSVANPIVGEIPTVGFLLLAHVRGVEPAPPGQRTPSRHDLLLDQSRRPRADKYRQLEPLDTKRVSARRRRAPCDPLTPGPFERVPV